MSDPVDQAILHWWKVIEVNGDQSILQKFVRLLPAGAGIDSSDPQSIQRSLAAAATSMRGRDGNKENHGGSESRTGRSPSNRLINAINRVVDEAKCDEENLYSVMANRDRAQEKVDKLAETIRSMPFNTERDKKRKAHNSYLRTISK